MSARGDGGATRLRAKAGQALLRNGFRRARLGQFVERLQIVPADRILDLGGTPATWAGTGMEGQVTLLNLELTGDLPAGMAFRQGDACDLTDLADRSFDVVFSNSVIEHVGDQARQARMAQEIRRVASGYWVQTPNRYFPVEMHFLFPGFQFLPRTLQAAVARWWPFSFPRLNGDDPMVELAGLRLTCYREMAAWFPDAHILRERVAGLTKSLVAVRARP